MYTVADISRISICFKYHLSLKNFKPPHLDRNSETQENSVRERCLSRFHNDPATLCNIRFLGSGRTRD